MASIYRRGKTWWISYRINGQNCYKSLKTADKGKARILKSQYEWKLAHGDILTAPKHTPARDALDKYLKHLELISSHKHARNREIALLDFLASQNITHLSDISREKIESYLMKRKDIGRSAHTLKNNFAAVKAWLNWCADNSLVAPLRMKGLAVPRTDKKPPEFLSKEEARKLLNTATGAMRQMIAIALYTGIRQGEMLRLRGQDIDIHKNSVMIRTSKTGEFRSVPFNPALKPYIISPTMPQGRLFPSFNTFPERLWRSCLKRAKMRVKWHNLRHTYASHLILSNVPIRVVSELLGHKNIGTTMIYSHLLESHKEQAARLIDF